MARHDADEGCRVNLSVVLDPRRRPPPSRSKVGGGLAAAMNLQLVEDVVHVILHRGDLYSQVPGDLLVGEAAVDEIADLQLAFRKDGDCVVGLPVDVAVAREDCDLMAERRGGARRAQELVAHRALQNADDVFRSRIVAHEASDAGGCQGDDLAVGLGDAERHDLRVRCLIGQRSCVAEIADARRIEQHYVGMQLDRPPRRLLQAGDADGTNPSQAAKQFLQCLLQQASVADDEDTQHPLGGQVGPRP